MVAGQDPVQSPRRPVRSTRGQAPGRYTFDSEDRDKKPTSVRSEPEDDTEPSLPASSTKQEKAKARPKADVRTPAKPPSSTARGQQKQTKTKEDEEEDEPPVSMKSSKKSSNTSAGSKKRNAASKDEAKPEPTTEKPAKTSISSRGGRQKQSATKRREEVADSGPVADLPAKAPPSAGRGGQKRATTMRATIMEEQEEEESFAYKRFPSTDLDAPTPVDTSAPLPSSASERSAAEQEEPTSAGKTTTSWAPVNSGPASNDRGSQKRQRDIEEDEGDLSSSKKRNKAPPAKTPTIAGCKSHKPLGSQKDQISDSDEDSPIRTKSSKVSSGSQKKQIEKADNRATSTGKASSKSGSASNTRGVRKRIVVDIDGISPEPESCIIMGGGQGTQAMEEDAEPEVGDEGNVESKLGDEGNAELDSTTAVRRSGRARNAVLPFGDECNKSDRSGSRSNASRRSQKRKAASQTPQEVEEEEEEEQFDLPDNLLEAALAPWKENELAQCPGWVELESEPQFLSEIMNAWGVTGAIVQELWSVDQEELSRLRRPVYGLVLLSKYTAKAPPETEKTDDLPWFANQTTSNACGTYALMNIVMNHEELSLGAKLKQVKEETKDLNSPQRGYVISKNTWLRSIHNSYARRLELMAESLVLQNQFDSDTERKRKPSPNKKTKTRKTGGGLAVHHFVGFVPVGNSVWYLDGMRKEGPVHLGKFDDGQDWTTLVEPVIQERAAKQAKSRAKNKHHLSLVAVCASENPVERIRAKLATNIRCLHDIQVKWGTNDDFISPSKQILETVNQDTMIFWETADDLQHYQLSKAEIDHLASPEAMVEAHKVDNGKAAGEMWTNLCVDQIVLREDYQKAMQESYEEAQRKAEKSSRADDLTPFIHEFIKELDKHYPALEELYMEAEQEEESRKARTIN